MVCGQASCQQGWAAGCISLWDPSRSLAGAFLFFVHIYSLLAQEKFWL